MATYNPSISAIYCEDLFTDEQTCPNCDSYDFTTHTKELINICNNCGHIWEIVGEDNGRNID